MLQEVVAKVQSKGYVFQMELMVLAKSMGFNGLRIHQKVEDPRMLYWCDRLGMLVWGEAANAYVFSDRAVEMLAREWLDVVRRDYNHPCIVTWVPLNESWGVPDLDRSSAFLRCDRLGALGARFAIRLSLSLNGSWVRRTITHSGNFALAQVIFEN